ncbi:MAG: Asp-tRNA(Asn)/Glu-tRNA(Gln) amidotransferase subunit GatC [Parcubacteria group bacterium]|nr:Asp-tRNA(Asn)/Glu-tRNA(Gln) amidotransferase subunit GatC [Parcubacteria group bacterium]
MPNKQKISEADIEHLAMLSRLGLSEEEKENLVPELARILDYVGELEKVNTGKIEPLAGGTDLFNVAREDISSMSRDSEALLKAAPSVENNFLKVPRILD